MPIPVECPDCFAALNVPEKLAGKTIKCPDCSSPVFVPSDEPEEDDRPRERRPRPAPRRADPPPRKRRAAQKGSSQLLLGVVAGVVVIAGVTVGAVYLARGPAKPTDANKTPDTAKGATDPAASPNPGPLAARPNPVVPFVPAGPPRPLSFRVDRRGVSERLRGPGHRRPDLRIELRRRIVVEIDHQFRIPYGRSKLSLRRGSV